MKFKNSYILLIVMTLLVVSIGSVCASDDNASLLTNSKIDTDNTTVEILNDKNSIIESETPVMSIDDENNTIKFEENNLTAIDNTTDEFAFEDENITSIDVNSTGHVELKLKPTNSTIENLFNITLDYSNSTKSVNNLKIENNMLTFDVGDLDFKSAGLLIYYNNTFKANLTLNRIYNARLDVMNNKAEYQSGNFTYKIIDVDSPSIPLKNKTITIDYAIKIGTTNYLGHLTTKTDNEGIVVFKNSEIFISYYNLALGVGINTVTITGDNLKIENPSQNVTITQAPIKITIDPYSEYYNSGKNIKIHVVNAKTNEAMKFIRLHIYMPTSTVKDNYLLTNSKGTGEIRVSNYGIGTHPITVNNIDTLNMTNVTASGSMIIKKSPVKINAKDITMYYNSGTTVTFSITKNGVPVRDVNVYVKIYSSNYNFTTDKNGKISLSKILKPPITQTTLNVGSHKMRIYLADSNYTANPVTKTIKVKKANAKIISPKITTYYKQNKYMIIKLINSNTKKGIYNVKLNFKLHISKTRYYNLNGITDKNGKITFPLNIEPNAKGQMTVHRDLKPGSYKVVISGKNTENIKFKKLTTKILVKKTPVKFVIKKTNKKYIMLTVKNKKINKIVSGMKVKVKVKSKVYTVKTNSKGIAKVSKVFKAGKYKVSVSSANKYCVGKTTNAIVKIKK